MQYKFDENTYIAYIYVYDNNMQQLIQQSIQNWIEKNDENEILRIGSGDCTEISFNIPTNVKSLMITMPKLKKINEKYLPPNLEYLYLQDTHLSYLPLNLPKTLKYLDCECCYMKILPESLPNNLLFINVLYNELSYLPENLPPNAQIQCDDEYIPSDMINHTIDSNDNVSIYMYSPQEYSKMWKEWHIKESKKRIIERNNIYKNELIKYKNTNI
jgi:hypothetical protein